MRIEMIDQNTQLSKKCQVCGSTEEHLLFRAQSVRANIAELIKAQIGQWDEHGWVCTTDLEKFRLLYVEKLLLDERLELGQLENDVLESLRKNELLSKDIGEQAESQYTFGQTLADKIAAFGGSWTFIITFAAIIFSWMLVNSYVLATRPFDPYPFILLNLVLSTLAALQAPVIMMSQNRQESRDRMQASHDYQINLKAELEIRLLHQKLDHLLLDRWESLIEIQNIQLDMLKEIINR